MGQTHKNHSWRRLQTRAGFVMQKRIFYSVFLVSAMLVLVANIALIISTEIIFKKQIITELKKQANSFLHIKDFGKNLGVDSANRADFSAQNRISIITQSGAVVFDNFANSLDNHINRAEIKATLSDGESVTERYSQSLGQNLIYYAKAFTHGGEKYIIRVATAKKSISDFMLHIIAFFALEVGILLCLCFLIARILTKWILSPIKNINLEQIDKNSAYAEFGAFIKKIKSQNKTIKKSYKKLLQKQQESILLAQNINDGFMLLNAKGNIVLANKALAKFVRVGENENILHIENATFAQIIMKNLSDFKAQRGGDSNNGGDSNIVRDSNNTGANHHKITQLCLNNCECEVVCSPIFVGHKCKGMMILVQNLDEEKRAQNLRKEFSANVTHELKTPLTSILASSEMLRNKLVQSADMPRFLDKIYNESKRLLEMIDEILKLSFFDENKQDSLQKERVDLREIALSVIARLQSVAQNRGVALRYDLQHTEIWGAHELLENLIYNLIDNAIKYNKIGGFVEIALFSNERKITLTVKDSGIGIAPNYHNRIFERFFRVEKSHSKALGGTGLGLSIVKHACIYHNAKISLTSEIGAGSEFRVEFESA